MIKKLDRESVMVATHRPQVTWEPLPPDYVLPDDPVENLHQPFLAAALTDALRENDRLNSEMLVGSNFGLVATIDGETVVKAPDWFLVKKTNTRFEKGIIPRSYTPNRDGDPVSIVMEFLSDGDNGELSVRSSPPFGKLYFYERILEVPTYITYDPFTRELEGRFLQDGSYRLQRAKGDQKLWIPELELFLGIWEGARPPIETHWLRWWDQNGELLLWGEEIALQEKNRADREQQRAEEEKQRADRERQRAEALLNKLKELGIDPE